MKLVIVPSACLTDIWMHKGPYDGNSPILDYYTLYPVLVRAVNLYQIRMAVEEERRRNNNSPASFHTQPPNCTISILIAKILGDARLMFYPNFLPNLRYGIPIDETYQLKMAHLEVGQVQCMQERCS